MGKICVTGEYVIKGDHDCIELRENGCLVVLDTEKEITINKLINHKEYRDNEYEYDILVTGINGEDALYGSGLNGEDGHNGGKVDITVLELDGSIHIKASGGNGGFGEKEEAVEFVQEASVLVVNREKKEPLADISEMVVMG